MASPAQALSSRTHFLADLYDFKWSAFNFRLPLPEFLAVIAALFALFAYSTVSVNYGVSIAFQFQCQDADAKSASCPRAARNSCTLFAT